MSPYGELVMRKNALILMGIAALIPTVGQSQTCASAAGNWTDNFGFRWALSQNGAGQINGTVDGSGIIVACPNPVFNVSGSFLGSGNFSVVATNPAPPGNASCVPNFTYAGAINKPGCNTGNGTFTNFLGSGQWNWSKPCELPSGETTIATGFGLGTDSTVQRWRQTLLGGNFSGRTVAEEPAPGGTGVTPAGSRVRRSIPSTQ